MKRGHLQAYSANDPCFKLGFVLFRSQKEKTAGLYTLIISASPSISIASGGLMVQNIRLPHLSVRKSELRQNG